MKKLTLQPCDIFLHRGKNWISRLIASESKGPYSHVSVYVAKMPRIIFESVIKGGVRCRHISEIKQDYDIFRVKEGIEFDKDKVVEFLAKKQNHNYDKKAIFYLGWLKILSLASKNMKVKKNKLQNENDFFCSEYSRLGFKEGGLDICPGKTGDSLTTPNDHARSPVLEKIAEIRH